MQLGKVNHSQKTASFFSLYDIQAVCFLHGGKQNFRPRFLSYLPLRPWEGRFTVDSYTEGCFLFVCFKNRISFLAAFLVKLVQFLSYLTPAPFQSPLSH